VADMSNVESQSVFKNRKSRIIAVAIIAIASGVVLWFVVLPFLLRYENLYIYSYYWVVNNHGKIGQLILDLRNNGTQDATIAEIWINGVRVDKDRWGGYFGIVVRPKYGEGIFVAPKGFGFESGQTYNLTISTVSGKHYSFLLEVNVDNTKSEDVAIAGCYFYTWPIMGPYPEKPYVGIEVKDVSATDLIVKKVWINDTLYELNPYLWLVSYHTTRGIEILYEWKTGLNYTVTIETAAGSTATVTATAD